MQLADAANVQGGAADEPPLMAIPCSLPASGAPDIPCARRLEELACTSLPLLLFLNRFLAAHEPVVISGYLKHSGWAALTKWGDLAWWKARYGHRLVRAVTAAPPPARSLLLFALAGSGFIRASGHS